ncbi:DUF4369 domain-containing protein [Joostella atrarenae]|uniref:DUF4369 domain-containing protein n=1 Tax=Joostella atrarenae TaxID=679257 RepID=A0ABS9J6W0_9FLAO|nr:DUF4369 domain-containing protein [Joostella atrarenae]MCF8716144.1 DUF4369 domain-containing protein [Joostella atrarenae]
MYRLLAPLLLVLVLASCGKNNDNMTVKGTVEGLRKGTLYFQKIEDSTMVTIDSLEIDGNSDFNFSTYIESPEVFTLYLDKNDGNLLNDRLDFFGEPGIITINTTRDYFAPEAKIEGSKSNDTWSEYKSILSKFSGKNLDLIKESIEAEKKGDQKLVDSLNQVSEKNSTRSYLYTLNFILNNKDSYAAPYITLANAYNTNAKYLDSINNSLTPEVAASKYGKMLDTFVKEVKEKEQTAATEEITE